MEQPELLSFVIDVLERVGAPYMLVGSLASSAYGYPRTTLDIDLVIDVTPTQLQALCAAFPSADFYLNSDAAMRALDQSAGQFNVIHPESGNKIDFMIARRDAWGIAQVSRRQRAEILPGVFGYTAGPEDVIIGKMLYYREGGSEKHLRDIASMLKVSAEVIDRDYVARWASQLGVLDVWQAVLHRLTQ